MYTEQPGDKPALWALVKKIILLKSQNWALIKLKDKKCGSENKTSRTGDFWPLPTQNQATCAPDFLPWPAQKQGTTRR